MFNRIIEKELRLAIGACLEEPDLTSLQVRPCPDPKFGDYQCNALMGLAKARKMNPRALAQEVVSRLKLDAWCEAVEVAGPGFLNFRIKPEALGTVLGRAAKGDHLFFEKAEEPRTVVIDFSSPNVAKPMHVGHIRSTILGDALARVNRLLGHQVITDNHIGDWGTQFGKLLVGWKQHRNEEALEKDPLGELERLYKTVNAAGESDPAVLEASRGELVKLQDGDEENLAIWNRMIELSRHQFDTVYTRLGVAFDHALGESFYNARLKPIVEELKSSGLARESEGAMVVFFEKNPSLKNHPALIQKSDGAANYTTTDLATLAYRLETWNPDEIIYVTDGRQQLHFQQLFAIFAQWRPKASVKVAHVWFGTILGDDNKPFKTRSGEVIKLVDLLDEAEERAYRLVTEKAEERQVKMEESRRREIARVIGLGAIKYADLLPNRQSDYVFSWDKMLALNGNTAPYLQYAYARTCSLFRKVKEEGIDYQPAQVESVTLSAPDEIALARHLLNFGMMLEVVAAEYRPNLLCTYLFELAGHFSKFWESCPVLKAEEAETRTNRLVLCDLTGRVIRQGLEVLGIETLEQM